MLDKIQFLNGTIVPREFLLEVQKGGSFSAETSRDNYYAEPTPAEHNSWAIGQRDRLKDWEIADPREDNETGVGRLAHDGIVLNSYNPETLEKVWGPPALVESSAGPGTYAVWVEAGSIIGSDGQTIGWPIQQVQLISGTQINYLFVDEKTAKENVAADEPVEVSIGSELPSPAQPHIPLAKLTLNPGGTSLATNEDGDVVGAGYIDLRPNVRIGNLNTYPKILRNTEIVNDSVTAQSWERVIVDTSNGSLIVELPTSPTDSDRIAIVDISGTFDRFPVVIRPGVDTKINNSVDDWIVNIKDAHLELFYHAATAEWKFEETPGGDCSPVLGSFLSCGGKEFIGQRMASECPDGEVLPAVFPNSPEGVYRYEPSTQKCYKEYYSTVAVYADGQGGLIRVQNAPRCNREGGVSDVLVRNIIYVDPATGDDSISNSGFDEDKPFRSIERALIQAVRESRRAGQYNDRYDRVVIQLAPGDYYVDNSPGANITPGLTTSSGLVQQVGTGLTITEFEELDRAVVIKVDALNPSINQPPVSLSLGRIIYSQSGGVGNIVKIEKESIGSSIWEVTLEYVKGSFNVNDEIFYDGLSVINPTRGGLIVPRGISINGVDLRKVRIRPMYVPGLNQVESEPQSERTSIFKVTGGTYISLLTFTDNPQLHRSHNTVTAITFASQEEIIGGGAETSYYSKLNSLFSQFDGWGASGLEPISAETTIVAPIADSKSLRQTDSEENQTGFPEADSRPGAPIAYPGATRITRLGSQQEVFDLPDINSTRSSSPYVFNCSVRSIFGMNGLWADGALVAGFKSMVTANFTQVSLQTDPTCFNEQAYYLDPPINKQDGAGKQYRVSSADPFKYRHFGMRGSNNATIQIVSVFVIGNADHFVADSGADLSITNSCSDFGDISLRSIGYKSKAFSQDEGLPTSTFGGTKLLEIIPPLPLTYDAIEGRGATLIDTEINTSLVLDYELTRDWYVDNYGANPPAQIRIYFKSSNTSSPFNATTRVPSANQMGFGQFSYTSLRPDNSYELVGGNRQNRKQIRIKGFDEVGNSIIYTGNIAPIAAPLSSPGFEYLDDKSKIFIWDNARQNWYVNVTTLGITEEQTDLDGDGFLLKRFDYAFRYKVIANPTGSDVFFKNLDFMFDRSSLTIIRGLDRRKNEERVYKIVLDGFDRSQGLRRPQNFYILEKQTSVSGFPLNGSNTLAVDPLTVSQIRSYKEVTGIDDENLRGRYIGYLTLASQARKVPTGDFYPTINADEPELTQDPLDSITRQSLVEMLQRPGVHFNKPIGPSAEPILVKVAANSSTDGILINFRRPSVIRASGHTWEWTGYLNYDTAFPTFQGEPLDQDFALGKIIVEETGGKVYATGMNEEGSFYIGTTVFDLRTGEQFAIPLEADNEPGSVTNQIFNSVVVRSLLAMDDGSSLFFGTDSAVYFDSTTTINTLTGPLSASQNPLPEVYATTSKAGFVQLADDSVIRGALGAGGRGISERVAVTAASLARELNIRLDNSISGGTGISISQNLIELPGGDPTDPSDNVLSSTISAGLPGSTDPVAFSGLRLGNTTGTLVDNIVTTIGTPGSNSNIPTERAVRAAIGSISDLTGGDGIDVIGKEIAVDETVVRTLVGGATLVVLHVCPANATPLTGNDSVPDGYPTTNHGYQEGGVGLRGQIFRTVTEALVKASSIFVPIGAEIIISVHAPINATEAGPLMLSNSTAPFVIAGARGAATTPRIRLSRVSSANCSDRLPQYSEFLFSAGAIFQDINVEVDCSNTGSGENNVVGFLTFNGGFGVSKRDVNITWNNVPTNGVINNATAPYGGKVVFRMSSNINDSDFSDRSIYTNINMNNTNQSCEFNMVGQAGGLLGHGISIVYDMKSGYGTGAAEAGTLVWKFNHNSSNANGITLKFLGCCGRGGCSSGGRVAPLVKWDFGSNKTWNLSKFVETFSLRKNYQGRSFGTVPNGIIMNNASRTSLSSSTLTLRLGAIVDAGNNRKSGPFSLIEEHSTASPPINANDGAGGRPNEGSYYYTANIPD
jgi:hypothetical protein